MEQLNQIRAPQKSDSRKKQVLVTAVVLLLGICLGWFSKYLDERQAELPGLLAKLDELLDFHNFLGGFAPWILIAVCLSVYSHTPFRAGINVFFFFVGFGVERALKFRGNAAEFAKSLAKGFGELGQALRPEYQQCDNKDDQEFCSAYAKHVKPRSGNEEAKLVIFFSMPNGFIVLSRSKRYFL